MLQKTRRKMTSAGRVCSVESLELEVAKYTAGPLFCCSKAPAIVSMYGGRKEGGGRECRRGRERERTFEHAIIKS